MSTELLQAFVQYCHQHLRGDEKSEAQVFLDRLFMALGHPQGVKSAGATLEERIKSKDRRSARFAGWSGERSAGVYHRRLCGVQRIRKRLPLSRGSLFEVSTLNIFYE